MPDCTGYHFADHCGDTPPQRVDLRERFAKRFERDTDPNDRVNGWLRRINGDGTVSIALPEDVIDFITKELADARRAMIEEMEKAVDKIEIDSKNEHTPYWRLGAARFRKNVLTLLNNLKEDI